ncbi:unnamed protein product [Closterium sp. Naga37s-1]|nr:unnamed protein product [Closterium sp. Naga37s-1]
MAPRCSSPDGLEANVSSPHSELLLLPSSPASSLPPTTPTAAAHHPPNTWVAGSDSGEEYTASATTSCTAPRLHSRSSATLQTSPSARHGSLVRLTITLPQVSDGERCGEKCVWVGQGVAEGREVVVAWLGVSASEAGSYAPSHPFLSSLPPLSLPSPLLPLSFFTPLQLRRGQHRQPAPAAGGRSLLPCHERQGGHGSAPRCWSREGPQLDNCINFHMPIQSMRAWEQGMFLSVQGRLNPLLTGCSLHQRTESVAYNSGQRDWSIFLSSSKGYRWVPHSGRNRVINNQPRRAAGVGGAWGCSEEVQLWQLLVCCN